MIDTRNFVRVPRERLDLEIEWAPARFGGTGPCFAARETSGMLQMISRLRNAWPSRPRAANVRQRCSERLSALACGAVRALRPWLRQGHSSWSGGVMVT